MFPDNWVFPQKHHCSIIVSEITNAREGVEERKSSYTVSGSVNWYNHYGEQYGGSSKTKNRVAI